MPFVGDPQGTQARAFDAEREHPVGPQDEPPASYRRTQLWVAAALIGIPILLYVASRMLR